MNLKDIQDTTVGASIEVLALVKNIEKKTKTNNEPFIMLTIADKTGDITFPVWDHVEARLNILEEGMVIKIIGSVGEYNGAKQIRVNGMMKAEDADILDFIPRYDIESLERALFNILIRISKLNEPYKSFTCSYLGIEEDIVEQYLVGKTLTDIPPNTYDLKTIPKESKMYKLFYTPAAVHHHQNKVGGLLLHTSGVVNNVASIIDNYIETPFQPVPSVVNDDRLIMCAILHDIEKIQEYTWEPFIEKLPTKFDHRLLFVKESEKLNAQGNFFTDEELMEIQENILTHHGMWSAHKPKTLEQMILFTADLLDANISECVENDTTKVDMKLGRMIDAE